MQLSVMGWPLREKPKGVPRAAGPSSRFSSEVWSLNPQLWAFNGKFPAENDLPPRREELDPQSGTLSGLGRNRYSSLYHLR
jgi:hypothetical protein